MHFINMDQIFRSKEIYTPFEKIENGAIVIRDGIIVDLLKQPNGKTTYKNAEFVDLGDYVIAPGFVEVHVNGAGGADVMEGSFEKLGQTASTLARFGTTAFIPTVITATEEHMLRVLSELGKSLAQIEQGAIPLGIHLEGPFLSKTKRGTHPAKHLRVPSLEFFKKAHNASQGKLRILTLAPELDGALELIREARARGLIVALGHSDATYEQTLHAIDAGATHAVHIFNAMRPLHQREPGIIGALLTDDRISAEIITDGIHVHPAVIKAFVKAKTLDKIVLSTDGTAATAMPDGKYLLGGRYITVKEGACQDEDGHLAGSSLSQDRALRNLLSWTDLSWRDALITATANPANVLGLKNKGVIRAGADADFVVLDSKLEVQKTIVKGKIVYSKRG